MIPNRTAESGEPARRERGRLEGGMNSVRNVEFLELREQRIEIRMPMRFALMVERRDECPFASVFHRALQLGARRGHIAHREMRDRNQAPAGVAAEVRDPSIV